MLRDIIMDETRLEKIESKIIFLEDSLEGLSKTVYTQQQQIDRLQALIDSLVTHVRELVDAAPEHAPANERPPHY